MRLSFAFALALVAGSWAAETEDLSYLTPDMAPIYQHFEVLPADSERVPVLRSSQKAAELSLLWETVVVSKGASWMKLEFGETDLGIGRENGPFLRLTSVLDGAVQYLDKVSMAEWYSTSAYFNGDAVKVELLARSSTTEEKSARVQIVGATVGEDKSPVDSSKSICDGVDVRRYSPEQQKSARYIGSGGCTGWIFNDRYNCFFTAGHCGVNAQRSGTMQFNVPLSSTTGAIRHPPPEDQFSVDATSVQMVNSGVGNDWGYLGTFVNSNTGRTAYEHVNGFVYTLGSASPPTSSTLSIHIAGFGTCETAFPQGACSSREYSQVNKNDTRTGGYTFTGTTIRYRTDTTGGNSGSGVEVVDGFTGRPENWRYTAIGIHTHGGCTATGGSNAGTALQNVGWTNARNSPRGVCLSGPRNTPMRRALGIATEN